MKIKVKCLQCGVVFEIEIHADEGYISFVDNGSDPWSGTAKHNVMTDGNSTVDLYCSDECRDN